MLQGMVKEAILDNEGALRIIGGLCAPRVGNLISIILTKDHNYMYSIHLGENKMYRDLKQHYWW